MCIISVCSFFKIVAIISVKKATFSFSPCLRRSVISMLGFSLFLLVILTFAEWPVIKDSHPLCTGKVGAGVEMEDKNRWSDQKEALSRVRRVGVSSLTGNLWKQGILPLPSAVPGWPCLLVLPLFLIVKEMAVNCALRLALQKVFRRVGVIAQWGENKFWNVCYVFRSGTDVCVAWGRLASCFLICSLNITTLLQSMLFLILAVFSV